MTYTWFAGGETWDTSSTTGKGEWIEGFMCQVTNPDMKRLDQLCQDHGLIMEKEITMSETKDHDTGRIIIRDGRIDFCEWRRL